MLQIGSRDKLHIRRIEFPFCCNMRLLYISDLHLSAWASHILNQLLDVSVQTKPDVIVLGGDLVETLSGLPLLSAFIQAQSCSVYAVGGNHDEMVGINQVRECVIHSGACWLTSPIFIQDGFAISGICTRVEATYSILCAHNPAVFPDAIQAGFDLTLAGHLHGGQVVIGQCRGKLYPGAWVYRWTGDMFQVGKSTMVVSRGVHDTIPVRWNCPREVILCCC